MRKERALSAYSVYAQAKTHLRVCVLFSCVAPLASLPGGHVYHAGAVLHRQQIQQLHVALLCMVCIWRVCNHASFVFSCRGPSITLHACPCPSRTRKGSVPALQHWSSCHASALSTAVIAPGANMYVIRAMLPRTCNQNNFGNCVRRQDNSPLATLPPPGRISVTCNKSVG